MRTCLNHPDRPHTAKDLCKYCYAKVRNANLTPQQKEKESLRNKKRWAALSEDARKDKTYRGSYGITYETAKQMLQSQDNRCGCCGDSIELGFNKGVIDHCHKTNKLRSVLCYACNIALGFVYDDTERLEKLIIYLRRHDVHIQ